MSGLVILVPILLGMIIAITFDQDWPWFIYPIIWVVGLVWIWRPRHAS